MYLLKENRYVALIISVIFVCIGIISWFWGFIENNANRMNPTKGSSYSSIGIGLSNGSHYLNRADSISHNYASLEKERRVYRTVVQSSNSISNENIDRFTGVHQQYQIYLSRNQAAVDQILAKEQAVEAEIAAEQVNLSLPPDKIYFTRTELLSQADKDQATWEYTLSDEELQLLYKIVMAEAEGEPYEGKVAVANVVLNRLRSANYPDTIKDVIYQKSQFSPVSNGRMDRVIPDEDSIKAVTEALHGRKEVSDDTYYFLSLSLATDLTIVRTKTKTEQIGNHTFYK